MPTGVMITVQIDDDTLTRIVRIRARGTDLSKIHACNTVSRRVDGEGMSAEEALQELKRIESDKSTGNLRMVCACALSSAFFCVMFGGGWMEFGVALFCGMICQLVLHFSNIHHLPGPLISMLMSFLITLETLLVARIFPELCTEAVISGAMMPLVPGLMLTAAIRDTIRGDLVSGGARVLEAVLTAVTLGGGAAIMLKMWNGPISNVAAPVDSMAIRLAGCLAATVMFGILFNQPRYTLLLTGVLGTAGYYLFLLLGANAMAYFVAALLIGLVSELMARLLRCPATMLITPGIIPMVPGLGLYRTMLLFSQAHYRQCAAYGSDTMMGILAIALAVTVSTVFVATINHNVRKGKSCPRA